MKNTILIAAAIMMATPAFASKARLSALGDSAHLVDIQTSFEKPHEYTELGELATFEWGGQNAAVPHAEGGFLRKHNEAAWGIYLGRQSSDFNTLVNTVNGIGGAVPATFKFEENSLNLMYGAKAGALSWGLTFKYSKADDKTVAQAATDGPQKSDSMGLAFGITDGVWDAAAVVGLSGNSSVDTNVGEYKIKNTGNNKVHGGMYFDTMYAYGSFKMSGAKLETPAGTAQEIERQNIQVGVVNTTKVEGADFFYGVSYLMGTEKEKVADTKTDTSSLPVIMGVEAEATSWLTLRASLTQNVLLGETKTAAAKSTVADNTTVAAGAGLKFGKLSLDGVLTTGGGQLLDNHGTDGLMSEASLTYTF